MSPPPPPAPVVVVLVVVASPASSTSRHGCENSLRPRYLYVDPGSPTSVLDTTVLVHLFPPGMTTSRRNNPPSSIPPSETSNARWRDDGRLSGRSTTKPA